MKQTLVPPPPPRTCMHVPFLFLIINFVFITNLQFQNSKTTTCYFIHGYIIMYVYMNIHVHCFMASLDKLLDPHTRVILFKYLIQDINLLIIWIFCSFFKENVEIITEKYICANSPMGESSP